MQELESLQSLLNLCLMAKIEGFEPEFKSVYKKFAVLAAMFAVSFGISPDELKECAHEFTKQNPKSDSDKSGSKDAST